MSTVQRKVFEQLKSFMVRITFNKKYIFAGLVKKPHAGGNSRKPQGQARSSGEEQGGEKGEALLGCPPMPGKKGRDLFFPKIPQLFSLGQVSETVQTRRAGRAGHSWAGGHSTRTSPLPLCYTKL